MSHAFAFLHLLHACTLTHFPGINSTPRPSALAGPGAFACARSSPPGRCRFVYDSRWHGDRSTNNALPPAAAAVPVAAVRQPCWQQSLSPSSCHVAQERHQKAQWCRAVTVARSLRPACHTVKSGIMAVVQCKRIGHLQFRPITHRLSGIRFCTPYVFFLFMSSLVAGAVRGRAALSAIRRWRAANSAACLTLRAE